MMKGSICSRIDSMLLNPKIYRYNMVLYRYYFVINILEEILNHISDEEVVAISGGIALNHIWEKFSPDLQNKIAYVVEEEKESIFCVGKTCISSDEILKHDINTVILVANKTRQKIKNKIEKTAIKVIDLYEILYKEKINMGEEYFAGVDYSYGGILQDLCSLNKCEGKLYTIILKKLIGEYFHIRDFESAFRMIKLLSESSDDESVFYQKLEERIKEELMLLRGTVSSKQHILVNWLDAVPPEAVEHMPYLRGKMNEGIYFENAHTVVKHTKPTMKTIFAGKTYIDDGLFRMKMDDLENEKLYRILGSHGYRFRYLGGYMRYGMFKNVHTIPYIYSTNHFQLASTILQWAAVREMEECTQKTFFLIHNLVEGHEFLNGDMDLLKEETIFDPHEKRKLHKAISYHYLDRQLAFYAPLYQNPEYQIVMSDHGVNDGTVPDDWSEFTHIILLILGDGIKTAKIDDMASLVSFPDIVECLMEKDSDKIVPKVCRDYALVQTEDMYNIHGMDSIYADIHRFEDSYMQRRGVITRKDSFYIKATGEEFYFIKGDTTNYINKVEYSDRINELRVIAGNKFIDISRYEKYFGSKKMYDLLGYKDSDYIELV